MICLNPSLGGIQIDIFIVKEKKMNSTINLQIISQSDTVKLFKKKALIMLHRWIRSERTYGCVRFGKGIYVIELRSPVACLIIRVLCGEDVFV
jgi:hypothetical protein